MGFWEELGLINKKDKLEFYNKDLPKIAAKLKERGIKLREGRKLPLEHKGEKYMLDDIVDIIDKFDIGIELGIIPKK